MGTRFPPRSPWNSTRVSLHQTSRTSGQVLITNVPLGSPVYDAWMHPELKKLGWDTVLKKGQVYNNWVRMNIKSQ